MNLKESKHGFPRRKGGNDVIILISLFLETISMQYGKPM